VLVAWGFTLTGERGLLDVTLGMRERDEDWLGSDVASLGGACPTRSSSWPTGHRA
jgi:hypothetical protein